MNRQKQNEPDLHNSPEGIDTDRLLAWWNRQAKAQPQSAGILQVYAEPRFGLQYRQEAEWLHFLRKVTLHKSMHVLELGCGSGRWALRFAPIVRKVVGVDFSEEMIKLSRARQSCLGLNNVEFYVATAQDLLLEEKFDLIYLSGITSSLNEEQLRQTLCHIQTMLAPGGVLVDRTSISLDKREVYDDGNYQGIYRTLQEQMTVFNQFGFHLTYHAPSYNRMHLPHFLLNRYLFKVFMEAGLHLFPASFVKFIENTSCLFQKLIPRVTVPETRSHDFFIFHMVSPE